MTVGINLRQMRIAEQAIAQNKFGYLRIKDHELLDKILEEIHNNEMYQVVGSAIEEYANELVEKECKPEWDRLLEEMKPLGERRNELDKEKASDKENFSEEKENELQELNKKIADLSNEYQKITDAANEKLGVFKEEKLSEGEGAAFFLDEEEYELADKLLGWKAYSGATE